MPKLAMRATLLFAPVALAAMSLVRPAHAEAINLVCSGTIPVVQTLGDARDRFERPPVTVRTEGTVHFEVIIDVENKSAKVDGQPTRVVSITDDEIVLEERAVFGLLRSQIAISRKTGVYRAQGQGQCVKAEAKNLF